MSVIELLRQATARRQAIFAYARMHDEWSEVEQLYTGEGKAYEAEGAHQWALIALRAYRAEMDDPDIAP